MTTLNFYAPEQLSALVDGEFVSDVADARMQGGLQSSEVYGDWNTYQVIGDVLKSSAAFQSSPVQGADPAFLRRLNQRLEDEKIAPLLLAALNPQPVAMFRQPAANEGVFRWKLVTGFASLSAALVVAWSFTAAPAVSTVLQLAQNPTVEQVVVASPQGLMVRDARLEELMAAHKQLGGSSLQAPSGFLRNAGFENQQSGTR